MSKKKAFETLKQHPLSNFEIMEKIDLEPSNIFTFEELKQVNNIDDLLDRKGRGIMLYLTENETSGHWIALLKRNNNIEIYDSYGFNPKNWEKELAAGNDRFDQDYEILKDLIEKSGYTYNYNKNKHQKLDQNINTCGRHSIMRLLFSKFNINEYNKFLEDIEKKYNVNPDELSIGLTENINNKT